MGDSPEKPKTGNVQVLERAFDLLEALAQSREPLGLSALATQTAMSKSTVHRILATMLERDYDTKTLNGAYAIGPKLFSMLSYHINSLELQVEAKPHLAALERELKLPAYLGVLDGPFVSIISKEATNRADELFTRVGKRYPAHCSSMGKCLLACLSADELEETLYVRGAHGQHHHEQTGVLEISAWRASSRMGRRLRGVRGEPPLPRGAHLRFLRRRHRRRGRERLERRHA